jgi:thioesterase domain-containing protein/acyl carrier protein
VVLAREDRPGETVLVAYVVAAAGLPPESAELQRFLGERLPAYMVPAAFVLLDRLPLTANDKVDRAALPAPEKSRPGSARDYLAPRDELELQLVRIWERLLGVQPVGVRDDFFALGGHSLLAVQLMARIQSQLGPSLPTATLLRHPTVERLAAHLREEAGPIHRAALVEIEPGNGRPLFLVHPIGGGVLCYAPLARHLAAERAVYGLQAPDRVDGEEEPSIEPMAARYLAEVKAVQPAGPYALGGWSMGGVVAFEMARQLEAAGETVELLALLDSAAPGAVATRRLEGGELVALFAADLVRLAADAPVAAVAPPEDLAHWSVEEALRWLSAEAERAGLLPEGQGESALARRFAVFSANYRALEGYTGRTSAAPITLFRATAQLDGDLGWGRFAERPVEVCHLPADHYSLLREPQVEDLAALLRERLGQDRGTAPARPPEQNRIQVRPSR